MKSYFDILKAHIEAHPPNYGESDIHSILEMLRNTYCQHNKLLSVTFVAEYIKCLPHTRRQEMYKAGTNRR